MNWRRGLLRLWLVGSVCWGGLIGWQCYDQISHLGWFPDPLTPSECADAMAATEPSVNPYSCFDEIMPTTDKMLAYVVNLHRRSIILRHLWLGVAPVIGVLGFGFIGAWVASGFKRKPSNRDKGYLS